MIPQNIIDTINDLPIEDVVRKWGVELKKKGARYEACCPLHGEKTPSFSVHTGKNIFKCFGCNEGGGPINFVRKHDKVEWLEAVKRIADAFKIALPKVEANPKEAEEHKKRESLMIANEYALKYFLQAYEECAEAKTYATKRWTKDSIKLFGIGWAPDTFNGLKDWAAKNGLKQDILLEAGLLKETNGKVFDFFRGRLIIPVPNKYGRIVGFTGRLLKEVEGSPKYMNTSETPIYQKKDILYGMFQARAEIIKEGFAFLAEGNPDVIKMHQLGVGNTVAPMGSGITVEHCHELRRICKTVTIISETDRAGIAAVIRNGKLLMKQGFRVNVLALPEEYNEKKERVKHDADSFFKDSKHVVEWRKDNTFDFILWLAEQLLTNAPVEKKDTYIDDICHVVVETYNPELVDYYTYLLSTVYKPKKMWADKIKSILKELDPKEEPSKLPKNVDSADFEKYGFYSDKNCLYFSGKFGITRGSNFTIEPRFHVVSILNSKRLFKITNEFGHSEDIELKQEELISLAKFQLRVESLGNFIWEGGESELKKYKRCIYEKTETCYEIAKLGWQKEGFWAWGNGVFSNTFLKTTKDGIVTIGPKNYYLPATSNIFEHEDTLFQFERKFIHLNTGTISFHDYAAQMVKVFGDNAKIGLCFMIATLFRDFIFKTTKFFPILNGFGPKGTGKSAMAHSLMAFFILDNKPPNINNSTIPALADVVSQACNACTHIDEYKNSTELDKTEFLKGSWDGSGRTRMNMDRDKKRETTSVDAGIILTGQEMPTADNALFSRLVFLTFIQTVYSEREDEDFKLLRTIEEKGLTHITNTLIALRPHLVEGFYTAWNTATDEMNVLLGEAKVEARVFKNWSILAGAFLALEPYLSLPFKSKDIIRLCTEGMIRQNRETKRSNELSTFWSIVDYLVQDGLIDNEVDYRIERLNVLKTDKIDADYQEPKTVLFINHTRIFQLYQKHAKVSTERVLATNSLQYYLQNSKEYLGMKKSMAFKIKDHVTRGFAEESVKVDELGTYEKKKKLQVTTAYCFDYDAIGINIDYVTENRAIVPIEEALVVADVDDKQKEIPF